LGITDGQGNIVERMAYTAFGERRKGDWRVSDPLRIGILFDFLIDFTEVLSGDGGVITTSCLHFLVTASIRTVGEKHFIYLDKQLIAIHIKTDTTSTAGTPTTPIPDKTRYLHYVYAMRSTMLPCPSVMVSIEPRLS
jgi:hypothetical protein